MNEAMNETMSETNEANEMLNAPAVDLGGYYEDRQRIRWLGRFLLLRAVLEDENAAPRAGGNPQPTRTRALRPAARVLEHAIAGEGEPLVPAQAGSRDIRRTTDRSTHPSVPCS
jgi:hypothetical protein